MVDISKLHENHLHEMDQMVDNHFWQMNLKSGQLSQ
jgi:hypothetical protein